MVAKQIIVGVSSAILISAGALFYFMDKTVPEPDKTVEKTTVATRQKTTPTPQEEKKYDLYSSTPYDLPLYSIVEISKLSPVLKKEIDKLLELSQGFYYLKRESENRVFIILQNSTSEADIYPRHNLEFAELYLDENNQVVKNIYPPSFNGIDGETINAIEEANSKPDIWKFDKTTEPFRPIKHSSYDENGKLKFTEYWNYSEEENVKYQIKDKKNKIISILKEIVDGDSNYRREHIFYNNDGAVELSLSANYDGANISRFTYYNLLNAEDCVTIISEFDENGNKNKESIYSSDYQLQKIIKVDFKDGERKTISVFDHEDKLLDEISS